MPRDASTGHRKSASKDDYQIAVATGRIAGRSGAATDDVVTGRLTEAEAIHVLQQAALTGTSAHSRSAFHVDVHRRLFDQLLTGTQSADTIALVRQLLRREHYRHGGGAIRLFFYRATAHGSPTTGARLNDCLLARTTASASTPAYKEQIHAAVASAAELPRGPVRLELAFVVGPARNWLNPWKQTIDSLDPLLGRTYTGRAWNPRDGRVTELGMHLTVDPALRYEVAVGIAAACAPSGATQPSPVAGLDAD
jgi:hypothetical protein